MTHSPNRIAFTVSKQSITVNFDGQTHTVLATDTDTYNNVKLALKEGRNEDVKVLVNKPLHIEKSSGGFFQVRDGKVLIDGTEVHGDLGRQIMDFSNEGLPFEPLVKFYRNLCKNPSARVVSQLFSFLEKNQHPITEDGKFIAYKKVGADFKDLYTHTLDNSPGKTLEVPRNQVDENPNVTCSFGLHVANWDYAANKYGTSADIMLEVEVCPSSVVAIPLDYNESKLRVAAYTVRSVVTNPNGNKVLVRDEKPVVTCDRTGEPCTQVKDCCYASTDEECEDEEECFGCDGTGTEIVPCPECNGEGEIEEDCADCGGSGLEQDFIDKMKDEENPTDPEVETVEEEEPLVFQDGWSLKKMSSDRLKKYQKKLFGMEGTMMTDEESESWNDTLNFIEDLLESRNQ